MPEVDEAMLNDENIELLRLIPDCIDDADSKIGGMCQILKGAANPEHFTKKAIECPLAFNSELALTIVDFGSAIDEGAQLHAINRVLCATNPTEDATFNTK